MNVKNNKRHQATLQKIDNALTELLQNKSLHEINVADLCAQAEINRSTFYAHYDDVSKLAEAFSERTEKLILAQPHTDNEYSWLFSYIQDHPNAFTAYFKLGIRKVQADYKMLFLRSAVHGVAKLWFENGCIETPEQMSALVMREMKFDCCQDLLS